MRSKGIILATMLAVAPLRGEACEMPPVDIQLDDLFAAAGVALVELELLDVRETDRERVIEGWKPEPDEPSIAKLYILKARVLETLKGPHTETMTLLWRGGNYPLLTRRGWIAIAPPGAAVFPDMVKRPQELTADGVPMAEIIPQADPCSCQLYGECWAHPFQFEESDSPVVRAGAKERVK